MTQEITTRGTDCAFPSDAGLLSSERRGMTKREHFSALILTGYMANPYFAHLSIESLSNLAVTAADVLVARLAECDREDG